MREAPPALLARFRRRDLTMCRILDITLRNGQVYRYTDLSNPVTFEGNKYDASPGVEVSSIRNASTGASQNASAKLAYRDTLISETMARQGMVDGATYLLRVIDYLDLSAGAGVLFEGRVTGVNITDIATCDLSLTSKAKEAATLVIGEAYSQRCRNVFGDERCKMDPALGEKEFTVTSVPTPATITINTPFAGGPSPVHTETTSLLQTFQFAQDIPDGDNASFYDDSFKLFDWLVPEYDVLEIELISSAGGQGAAVHQNNPTGRLYLPGENGDDGDYCSIGYPLAEQPLVALRGGAKGFGGTTSGTAGTNRTPPPSPVPDLLPQSYNGPGSRPRFQPDKVYPGGGASAATRDNSWFGDPGTQGGSAGNGHRATFSIARNDPGAPVPGTTLKVFTGHGGAGGLDYPQFTGGVDYYGLRGGKGRVNIVSHINTTIVEDQEFAVGKVIWTYGDNTGDITTITGNAEGTISLASSPAFPVRKGDRGRFQTGCSNYADMCKLRYDNLRNMQAEPVVPQGTSNAPSPPPAVDTTKPAPIPMPTQNVPFTMGPPQGA